jgi:hypothetical protein
VNPMAGDSDALSRPFKDQSIIVTHPEAMSPRLVERAASVGSATVHEAAGRIGALPEMWKEGDARRVDYQ